MNNGDDQGKSASQVAGEIIAGVTGGEPTPTNQDTPTPTPETKPDTTPSVPDISKIQIPDAVLGTPKPEPEPPAAPKPDAGHDDDEPEEIKNSHEKARKAFATLRTQLAQARAELDIARSQAAPPDGQNKMEQALESKKQIDELQAKLNEAYDKIGRYSLEADPRFKAKYQSQQNAITDQIKEIAKEWEVDDSIIAEIVRATPKKRVEIINENSPDLMPIVTPLLAQYDHIERLKQMELAKHKETMNDLDAEQQKQQVMRDRAGREAMFKTAVSSVLQNGFTVLNPVPGQDDWNKNVVEPMHQRIRMLFDRDDPLAQSESLILGVTAPIYKRMFEVEHAKLVALQAEMKKRYGVRPGLDARDPGATPQASNEEGKSAEFIVGNILQDELGQN